MFATVPCSNSAFIMEQLILYYNCLFLCLSIYKTVSSLRDMTFYLCILKVFLFLFLIKLSIKNSYWERGKDVRKASPRKNQWSVFGEWAGTFQVNQEKDEYLVEGTSSGIMCYAQRHEQVFRKWQVAWKV